MNIAHDFTVRLQDLLRRERSALGAFLVALAEFHALRLWLVLGYASLFDYLHRELGLSKGAAFYRKTAAELVGRFPEIAEALADGRLCLMTVAEVARVLTPENRKEVLPRFFGLSKREAQALAAELMPAEAPPVRAVVTAVRVSSPAPSLPQTIPALLAAVLPVEPSASPAAAARPAEPPSAAPPPPAQAVPLTAELSRFHATVSRRFLEKLEKAKAALSHSHPAAGPEEVLEAGLDLLLERHAKRQGLVMKPRKDPVPSADPDHIPAHVRRAVWERDGGKCRWPVSSGGVCACAVRPELHHVVSRARGGPTTVENLTTLCAVHHDVATRREFGDAVVDLHARRRWTPGGASKARPRAPGGGRHDSPPTTPSP